MVRKRKVKKGMWVRVHTNCTEGRVLDVDVSKDVEYPDDWQRGERVGTDDDKLVLIQYKWKPGGNNRYADRRGCYAVYPVGCLTSLDGTHLH